MIVRLTTFIAAALLILNWDQRRRAREQEQQRSKPAEVNTWEGEGGALPTVGSQLGPAPSSS
jgi:hypothetical protein